VPLHLAKRPAATGHPGLVSESAFEGFIEKPAGKSRGRQSGCQGCPISEGERTEAHRPSGERRRGEDASDSGENGSAEDQRSADAPVGRLRSENHVFLAWSLSRHLGLLEPERLFARFVSLPGFGALLLLVKLDPLGDSLRYQLGLFLGLSRLLDAPRHLERFFLDAFLHLSLNRRSRIGFGHRLSREKDELVTLVQDGQVDNLALTRQRRPGSRFTGSRMACRSPL